MKQLLTIFLLSWIALSSLGQTLEQRINQMILHADYDQALKTIRSQPQSSDALKNKEAEALMGLGKLNEAASLLSKINSDDAFIQATVQNNLGYLNLLRGRSDLAQDHFEKARDQFGQLGQQHTPESATCFSNLSLLYWSVGRLSQAEENGLQALQIRQQVFGDESEEVAASLNDLGLVYGSSNADKGLDYYEKAFSIYEKIYDQDHPKIAVANTNIGLMNLKLEMYGDASNHFEKALSIWRKTYPNGHPNEALVLANLGRTYLKMKKNEVALAYFDKALSIYQKNYGTKHPDIAETLNQLGSIKLSENNYAGALDDFQHALVANSISFQNESLQKNPAVQNFYNGKVLLYSLNLKAQALEAQYYGKTLKLKDITLALSCLQSCDSLIDTIRKNSSYENDKIELGSLANEVYEDGVRIAFAISEMVIKPDPFVKTAFYFAEKSKSAVLQESIADTQAKSFAGIPGELLEEEKNKKSNIAYLVEKLAGKPEANDEKYFRSALYESKLDYDRFIKKLEKDYPAYYNLKYNNAPASINDLQTTLNPGQAVVSFFVANRKKKIYQFVISTKKFNVYRQSLPDDFDRNCKGFINSLLYSNFEIFSQTQSLRKILRPRVNASIHELVIIPSGRLSALPFEALPLKKTAGQNFNSTDYFINKWALSYEFSAGLMLQKSKSKMSTTMNNVFLCAPIRFDSSKNLSDLPATENEVNTIAQLFQANAKVYTYARANEDLIKSKELQKFNILHLATHGIVDSDNPSQSEIFLNSGNTEDGNLYCREIYNMNFGADLVVLSACETGLGKFTKGEGVIGLSRALTYAGAKSIIVSFWKVSDESTSELMIDFYKHLLENKNHNFSRAIREAKLQVMKHPGYSSPYYWAPFVLIGK
ncbi:MAG: High-affnity carbon uptake protein Hat/HatR [Cytophagales bacterium]|jgi:tetratricopeptide (TPR) repeat protein|nr:CHAT domain-containing protein [Bacteroidota bacterium]MBS1980158.1 CHAT domain-containing protein [Bacteroidota bacterium]WHZ08669.1 MAG: High-affnity carbon uptake protein Hat/HatR [Cytophagales bacterium]